ncbi:MAG: ImmA/IrrE family metallo-endopeptidase [Gemmataceae bacterium]
MHRWIAEALRRVGTSAKGAHPPTGPVPMTRILETFQITLQPVPDLTRNRAREFLRLPAAEDPQSLSEHSQLSGLMVARATGSVVLVNATDILTRRRFTMAHELGHHLLHRPRMQSGMLRYDLAAEDGGHLSESALKQIEDEADLFAANMLMPEQWVRAWFVHQQREWDLSPGLAGSRLATLLLVSRQAANKRLAALGLTTDATDTGDLVEDEGCSPGTANDG